MSNPGPWTHATGIKAHIVIMLNPGIDIDDAHAQIGGLTRLPARKDPGRNFHLIGTHVTLGEMDMMADVHASWTAKPSKGMETRVIGEWVNEIRMMRSKGQPIVMSTSTNVCMNM